jgi:glycosyltransferase involved in cell wall biosynthesis
LLPILAGRFDDVYIVDGNSTDGTQEYARSLGVRVETQSDDRTPNLRIEDFTAARLRSWGFARHEWLFIIDSDEIFSPELMDLVQTIVLENGILKAHQFRRVAELSDGTVIKHAFFYPEYTMIRLFHMRSGITLIPNRRVHERFSVPEGVGVMKHEEAFFHLWPSPERFLSKLDHYITMEYQDAGGGALSTIRWVWWYNLRSIAGQTARAVRSWTVGSLRREAVLPWSFTWPMIRYRFRVIREGMRKVTIASDHRR